MRSLATISLEMTHGNNMARGYNEITWQDDAGKLHTIHCKLYTEKKSPQKFDK